ncbi:unnamed protein product [Acanthoscelides obtectus]|uniref:Uncharacterized protein n=1 Tax=Acanthoscelides obtectus TaxID=200917 RepID=A0A9P0Q6N0_ACAOB|nr:unnamed protein product [Acanthoscelides obtectus]CAK1641054.1 hypothetical protein AOBTE_LOCUS12114 [Acanthoscelides obtectus]
MSHFVNKIKINTSVHEISGCPLIKLRAKTSNHFLVPRAESRASIQQEPRFLSSRHEKTTGKSRHRATKVTSFKPERATEKSEERDYHPFYREISLVAGKLSGSLI